MDQNSWTDNPALSGIDSSKLQTLISLANQAQAKKQNDLLPFLLSALSTQSQQNFSFQPSEIDAIIQVLKIGKSPQEIQKIDRICKLMKQFRK